MYFINKQVFLKCINLAQVRNILYDYSPQSLYIEAYTYLTGYYKSLVSITTLNYLLQIFSQDYDLTFCTSPLMCVNFIHEWRVLQFKDFWKTFHSNFIYSLRCSRRRNIILYFVLFAIFDLLLESHLIS